MKLQHYMTAVATVGFGFLCSTAGLAHAHAQPAVYGTGIRSGELEHGGRYVFTPATSLPLTAVELWYAVPSIGYGAKPNTSVAKLAAQAVAASAPADGVSLGEYVSSIGGTLGIDVFPDSVAISALVPTPQAAATLHLMTQSYFSPFITDAGLRRAKLDLATQAILNEFDPADVMRTGLMTHMFSSGPAHYPTLAVHDLTTLDLAAVKNFAELGFQAQHASLIVSGSADPGLFDAVSPGRIESSNSRGQDADVLVSAVAATPMNATIKFNGVGSGFAWVGPGISDETSATAMDFIADYLFNPTTGKVTTRLAAETPNVSLSGQFITLRNPGVFVVSVSGEGSDAAAKIVRDEIAALDKPIATNDFARARNAFIFHLQSDLQTPSDFAASLGWYATEGRPAYAPGTDNGSGSYFRGAAQLSPKTIVDVAQKFLTSQPVTVTLQPIVKEKSR